MTKSIAKMVGSLVFFIGFFLVVCPLANANETADEDMAILAQKGWLQSPDGTKIEKSTWIRLTDDQKKKFVSNQQELDDEREEIKSKNFQADMIPIEYTDRNGKAQSTFVPVDPETGPLVNPDEVASAFRGGN